MLWSRSRLLNKVTRQSLPDLLVELLHAGGAHMAAGASRSGSNFGVLADLRDRLNSGSMQMLPVLLQAAMQTVYLALMHCLVHPLSTSVQGKEGAT